MLNVAMLQTITGLWRKLNMDYSSGNLAFFPFILPLLRICAFCVMQSAGAPGQ